MQTAKEVGDGRSDGHYIWQATANCCDADCILAKFLEFIESLTQGPQLKSKGKSVSYAECESHEQVQRLYSPTNFLVNCIWKLFWT